MANKIWLKTQETGRAVWANRRRPLVLAALALASLSTLAAVIARIAGETVVGNFLTRAWEWVVESSKLPIGRIGLIWLICTTALLLMCVLVMVLTAIWQLLPAFGERKKLEEQVRALGTERDSLEAERNALLQVSRHGRAATWVPPLGNEYDRKILTNAARGVAVKLEETVRWAKRVWREMQVRTYTAADSNSASMVGEQINSVELNHIQNALRTLTPPCPPSTPNATRVRHLSPPTSPTMSGGGRCCGLRHPLINALRSFPTTVSGLRRRPSLTRFCGHAPRTQTSL